MNYIVFDLEWNQCPYGKKRENPKLPFEIIEIGAVKLNSERQFVDSFRALVRPQVYPRLHFQTMKVVGIRDKDLKKGIPFETAADAFLRWCGPDCRFCTWGTLDLMEFQRNLEFFGMGDRLTGPIFYDDVQKMFAIAFENRSVRRALSYAVEYLNIPDTGGFHFAKEDAAYTAKIFQQIPQEIIESDYSIDCYRNPKCKEEEIRLRYAYYEKYISREFPTKEELTSNRDIRTVRCFECGKKVRRVVHWFADAGGRNYFSVSRCELHGFVKCKLRVREASDGCYYAVRTTKMITPEGLAEIRQKQAVLRQRRKSKRKSRL